MQEYYTVNQSYQNHLLCLNYQKSHHSVYFVFLWCPLPDSNRPPTDYKSVALPNELKGPINILIILHYILVYVYRLNVHRATYTHGKGLSSVFVQRHILPCNLHISGLQKTHK